MIPPQPEDNGERPEGKPRGKRREPSSLGAALKQSVGPLMRQFRKFNAMRECLSILPKEIMEAKLAAPFDVRRAPSRSEGEGGLDDVNTMYFYVASKTVKSVLERRKRQLIKAINARLEFAFVEEFRYEEVSAQKIERQLNILALTPD